MTAKNKKILIICIAFVLCITCVLIGVMISTNNGWTSTPDGKESNPNYYSKEIPYLDGIELGMTYDEVKSIENRKDLGKIEEENYDTNYLRDYYYIDSGKYAYSINSEYTVLRKIQYESLEENFRVTYGFYDKKLVELTISYLHFDTNFYHEIKDKYGDPNYIEGKSFGFKAYYWYMDKFIIELEDSNSLHMMIYDSKYDPNNITFE